MAQYIILSVLEVNTVPSSSQYQIISVQFILTKT